MMKMLIVAAAMAATAACGGSGGVMSEIEKGEQADAKAADEALAAMSRAVTEEAQSFPSGLSLQFVRRSIDETLARPSMNANVLVHYEGSFVEGGQVFDSSFGEDPVEFPLQGVVRGFSEAITQMRPGDEAIATFPGSLGYGSQGRGPIPPNAALRFRIVLLAFQEPGGQPVSAPGL